MSVDSRYKVVKKVLSKSLNLKIERIKKIPPMMLALALIVVGVASAIGYGYQKINNEGINGTINVISSQAIGIHSVRFIGWHDDDISAATVADDGLSYLVGLNLNNGDEYADSTQHLEMAFQNYAKTPIVIKLTTRISTTHPDPSDSATDDIHIFYGQDGTTKDNTIGQIDPWTYLIKLKPYAVVKNEIVDTGDGVTKTFYLDNSPVMHDSLVVYIDGVVNSTANYTVDEKEGIITFHNPPQAPDNILDADGTSSTSWGLPGDIDVLEADELEFFEIADLICTNDLANPSNIWLDIGTTADEFDGADSVILGSPNPGDTGLNIGNPVTGDPIHWKFYDENNNDQYDDGEDIILEGDQVDERYYIDQIITADYHWSGEKVRMYIDMGNTVKPGFYEFSTYIEANNWDNLRTVNM